MSGLGNKEIMAKNIQYYMNLHGKTRRDMCEAIGVKYTTFTDWVMARSYPRIDKIELMANYFGISKADLVEDSGVEKIQDELFRKRKLLFDKSAKASEEDLNRILAIVDALIANNPED